MPHHALHPTKPSPHRPFTQAMQCSAELSSPALYKLVDMETLFFAFHHLPGTTAHLLAAQELHRQDWRYHKWQGAWFQVRCRLG